MLLSSLTLKNFRCFGPESQTFSLRDLTALVGANGCGKTAVLQALLRLFGTTQSERTIVRSDFHLSVGKSWDDLETSELQIEATIALPELTDIDANKPGRTAAAACFKHMTANDVGERPYCRVRLDAKLTRSNLSEGDVEQDLLWIVSPHGTDAAREIKQEMKAHERSRIHVHYVPASRDPARQIRQVSGSVLHTLLRAVEWSDAATTTIQTASEEIRTAFTGEKGVEAIQQAIRGCWKELHGAPHHRQVSILPIAERLEDILYASIRLRIASGGGLGYSRPGWSPSAIRRKTLAASRC